jgi:hypothetical protein
MNEQFLLKQIPTQFFRKYSLNSYINYYIMAFIIVIFFYHK